jgi:Uma2 family endonuclease
MAEVIEGQRAFTVEDYHRMGDAGVFAPDERVELIRGVVREMSPKGKRHSVAVSLATNLFVRRLEGRATVQIQDAITLESVQSEPEPDLVVNSSPDPRDLRTKKSRPLLVMEVADSSLRFDREDKARLYAEAGIAEYWIVNLVDDRLEVFRDPANGAYQVRLVLKPGESVSPLSFSDLEVAVRDLIP